MIKSSFKLVPEGFENTLSEMDYLYEAMETGKSVSGRIIGVKWLNGQGSTWEIKFDEAPNVIGLVPEKESGLPAGTTMIAFVNQKINIKIKAIDKKEGTTACTRKEVVEESKKYLKLKKGDSVAALVRAITGKGVLVDLGGGIIVNISPEEAIISKSIPLELQYEIKQTIQVKITSAAKKEITAKPIDVWQNLNYKRGQIVSGMVIEKRNYIAFIKVRENIIGIAPGHGVYIGDSYTFQVKDLDLERKTLHLIKWNPKRRKPNGKRN